MVLAVPVPRTDRAAAPAAPAPPHAASPGTVAGALSVVYVVWGSTYLAIAVVIETMPPLIANGARFLTASLLMALILVVLRGPSRLRVSARALGSSALLGVGLLAVGIGTVSLGERYVPSGIAALLIAAVPLWVVLLRTATHDRPGWRTLLGVGVGLGGLAFMLLPGGTQPASGDDHDVVVWSIAILAGSACWAFFSFLSPRLPVPADPFVMSTYELLAGGIALVAVGLLRGETLSPGDYSARSWWAWAYLAVVGSLAAYTVYVWLLGNAPLSLVATYAYVNPVVAVLLGWWVKGEPLTSDVVIAGSIVLAGVVLVVSGERRTPRSALHAATEPQPEPPLRND